VGRTHPREETGQVFWVEQDFQEKRKSLECRGNQERENKYRGSLKGLGFYLREKNAKGKVATKVFERGLKKHKTRILEKTNLHHKGKRSSRKKKSSRIERKKKDRIKRNPHGVWLAAQGALQNKKKIGKEKEHGVTMPMGPVQNCGAPYHGKFRGKSPGKKKKGAPRSDIFENGKKGGKKGNYQRLKNLRKGRKPMGKDLKVCMEKGVPKKAEELQKGKKANRKKRKVSEKGSKGKGRKATLSQGKGAKS